MKTGTTTGTTAPGCRGAGNVRGQRLARLAVGCALALAPLAYAQEATPSQAEDSGRTPSELDTIVVIADSAQTATKTDTKLTEIPQSISVVTAEQITDRAVTNFQEVFRYSAGVASELNGVDTRAESIAVRGFGAAQYLDGINRMPVDNTIYASRMEVFTLERAEVLRGPSSVLYGAGGVGGLVNAVSKRPSHDFAGEVGLVFGSPTRKELQVDVNGGLTETLAGRVVAMKRDGELQWDDQADDRLTLLPSIKWTPREGTDVTLIGLYQKDDLGTQGHATMQRTLNAASDAERLPMDFFYGDKDFNRMKSDYKSLTLVFDHAFSDAVSFSSRTRRYQHDVDYAELWAAVGVVWTGNLLPREFYILDDAYEGLGTDNSVSFKFATGPFRHQLLAGVDYWRFEQERREGFSCAGLADPLFEALYGCFAGGSPPPLDLANPNYHEDFDYAYTIAKSSRSTQLGVYVQDQIKFGDRLSMVVGARRDKATAEAYSSIDPASGKEPDKHATTYRVGLIGELGNGVSPYISYSESFAPVPGVNFFGESFKPKEGRQYEVGVKWQVNRASLLSLSVFDIVESNYTVQDPDFLQNFIQLGEVGSKGLELEASVHYKGVDFNGAYSYIKAEDVDGNRAPVLPETTASLWATKSLWIGDSMKLRFGGGLRYTGDRIDSTLTHTTKAATVTDAMVDLERGNWKFALNVSNLFDREFFVYCLATNPGDGACYPVTPRTVLASVRYRF